MIIIYKPKINHVLRIPGKISTPSGKKKKKGKTNSINILIPGSNEISNKQWEEISKHKNIQAKIKSGEISTVSETKISDKTDKNGNKKKIEKSMPLFDMKTDEAITIIKDCNNIDTLEKWKKEKGVTEELRIEIKEQIEKIKRYIETGVMPKDEK